MNRTQKSELVFALREKLISNSFISIIHYRGMTDEQLYGLRTLLKSKNCGMKISKNTLDKVAIEGTDLKHLLPYLNGPTAILYSQDPIALSKILFDLGRKIECLEIKIGYLNKSLITDAAIKDMAKLGSIEEVRTSLLRKINNAQSTFVRIVSEYCKSRDC